MEYQFKKFEERNTRLETRITVTRSSSIGFPSSFYHENGIKGFKYALLFWTAAKHAIGIHFTNDEVEKKSAFLIAHSKQGYGGSIVVRSFFRHHKIDPGLHYGRYEWEKISDATTGELFVINLKART